MKRSNLTVILALLILSGCASGAKSKPTVLADKQNNIPADIPSQFLFRYQWLVNGKEKEEFQKLLTDEERRVFIDNFWLVRDPDPTTPENERKQQIDERIDDISNEIFFSMSDAGGLLFRSNGGFYGDMARVYLLHGAPDVLDRLEGRSFVDLMLWVYINPAREQEILYAFLFYEKAGGMTFRLFPQDGYTLDQCGALYEVAEFRTYAYNSTGQNCPSDLTDVYNEIWRATGRSGNLNGNLFVWALFNFSSNSNLKQGHALQPPQPASETAKKSGTRVSGEIQKPSNSAKQEILYAECNKCKSMIPAEFIIGKEFIVTAPWKNFDWIVKGEILELPLKYRIILSGDNGSQPIIFEDVMSLVSGRGSMEKYPKSILVVTLLHLEDIQTIPAGNYWVSIYIKNSLTGKYNAWTANFIKK